MLIFLGGNQNDQNGTVSNVSVLGVTVYMLMCRGGALIEVPI